MHRATAKDLLRTIRGSLSRYLSILLIIAIGVAFFAGISSTGDDMRLTAEKYYDESHTQDMQILSPLGFSDADLDAVREIDGVDQVVGSYFADCMAVCKDNFLARVLSLPENTDPGNEGYINRLLILEGRLPQRENECVIDENIKNEYGFTVGSTLTLRSADPDEDLDDTLENTEFSVVGVVNSPLYIDMSRRGSTTVGDGGLDAYLYVPAENFTYDSYTQLALTYAPAREFSAYDKDYLPSLDPLREALDQIAGERAQLRYEEIRDELRDKIEDGQSEIDDGHTQVSDARFQLADARSELADARQKLADARQEYEDGKTALRDQTDAGRKKLDDGQAAIDAGRTQYRDGMAQYKSGMAQLEENEAAVTEAEATVALLDQNYATLNAVLSTMQLGAPTMTVEQRQQLAGVLRGQLNRLPRAEGSSQGLGDMMYDENGVATPEKIAAVQALLPSYRDRAVAMAQAGRTQVDAARTQLADTKQQLDAVKTQLDTSQTDIDAGRTALTEAEQAGQKQLDDALQKIENGEKDLAEGESEYLREEADAREEIADAEKDLADAELKLVDARRMLADLEVPEWFISDRTESCLGYSGFSNDSERIDSLATVFPVFFLAVASLVCLTTLARMVAENRTEIGTFKALGYSNHRIRSKYMIYSLTATGLGCVIGLVVGFRLFPSTIINAYCMMYDLPSPQTPFHWPMAVACTAVALACVALVTFFVCRSTLRETPASIMRPKAPPAGKRILLEYIRPLWRRLSFSHKVTARNLFRYGKRVLMTLFGIAGSSALVLTGFGLQDALGEMVEKQFGDVFHYDLLAGYSSEAESDRQELTDFLNENNLVADWQPQARQIVHTTGSGKHHEVNLTVIDDPDHIADYISLQGRTSREPVRVPQNGGAVVTEKLASMLNLEEGSTLTIRDSNQKLHDLVISGVTENYTEHFLYLTEDYYRDVFGEDPDYNSVILHTADGADVQQLRQALLSDTAVQMVTSSDEMLEQGTYLTNNLGYVVAVLILSAALLSFVVLYNLSNVNITERTREIATLKVLGFYDGEVSAYIYRESIVLTVLGAAIGLGLGSIFIHFVVNTAEADTMMFARHIDFTSFLFSALLTFLFSFLVNLLMHFRLKKINMVESMKSVD